MADAEAQGIVGKVGSDLPVRAASAAVMIAVSALAIWLGGAYWSLFVLLISAGIFWEFWRLAGGVSRGFNGQILWSFFGLIYIGLAAFMLIEQRHQAGAMAILPIVGAVVATDIGAYFSGRLIGGPKIAPAISPSKTWAGLGGGIVGATLAFAAFSYPEWKADASAGIGCDADGVCAFPWIVMIIHGAVIAIVAQAGDFFESWMKRKAGVKDSSRLIPGHGGLFDRMDGLIAVCAVFAVLALLRVPGAG